ncbi:MAG: hypothetical protein DME26_22365 [Verrucomicrobia bacterium]|nr:MAG: hypothetical protein DME26_22365 [Verrucomicrobiota bacterium]
MVKQKLISKAWILSLALAGHISAQTNLLNDGGTAANLTQLTNKFQNSLDTNQPATATATLTSNGQVLTAEQMGETALDIPLRSVWYPAQRVSTNSYAVRADFKAAAAFPENRGGVMGWLDPVAAKGIAFQIIPDGDSSQATVSVINFLATDPDANDSLTNLFNVNGTPATNTTNSAVIQIALNASTNFSTFQLEFFAPTDADRAAVSNVTAHVVAKLFRTETNNTLIQIGPSIELLTDLPMPPAANHAVGYFASFDAIFGGGEIGDLDNLTLIGVDVPFVGSPTLTISRSASDVVLSWANSVTGFSLQANTDLGTGTWTTVPSSGNTATVPATNPMQYFRLVR